MTTSLASTSPVSPGWIDAFRAHARIHAFAALGLAAGAMIFLVSHEVIPETHRNGHQTPATLGLMAGFALMTVLDTTLG